MGVSGGPDGVFQTTRKSTRVYENYPMVAWGEVFFITLVLLDPASSLSIRTLCNQVTCVH